MEKKWLNEMPCMALAMLVIFFLMTHSPDSVDYDAPSYINFAMIRPPLYPIFIWMFHWAGSYQFILIVWIHAILTFSALLYARLWLKKNLQINDFLLLMMCFIVTLTILFHFQLILIGAEGLTFPFFIFTFFLLIECFKEFNLKKIIYLSLWTGILILTRLQFYYLYVFFIILIVWYFYKRVPFKLLSIAISILLISILLTCFIDRSYHYFKTGAFSTEPATGKLLIVQALFLTDKNSIIPNFKNPKEKDYFEKMITEIYRQKLNKEATLLTVKKISYYNFAYEEYNKNYIAINNVVTNVLSQVTPIEFNEITQNISKTLFLHYLKKNSIFILWKFITFIGGVPLFLFLLIITSTLIPKIFYSKNNKLSYSQLFVSVTILITFLNAATVALFETYLVAYFCYTQFLFYCLAAYFADRVFFNEKIDTIAIRDKLKSLHEITRMNYEKKF